MERQGTLSLKWEENGTSCFSSLKKSPLSTTRTPLIAKQQASLQPDTAAVRHKSKLIRMHWGQWTALGTGQAVAECFLLSTTNCCMDLLVNTSWLFGGCWEEKQLHQDLGIFVFFNC